MARGLLKNILGKWVVTDTVHTENTGHNVVHIQIEDSQITLANNLNIKFIEGEECEYDLMDISVFPYRVARIKFKDNDTTSTKKKTITKKSIKLILTKDFKNTKHTIICDGYESDKAVWSFWNISPNNNNRDYVCHFPVERSYIDSIKTIKVEK